MSSSGKSSSSTPGQQREVVDVNDERPSRLTDQRFAELRALADSLGLVVATRCHYCGSPLWAPASLEAGIGPVCATKHKSGVGILDQDSPDAA